MNVPTSSAPNPMLTEIILPGLVEPDGLIVQHRPVPTPGEGQALVEMLATGVSFSEQGMRRGRYPGQPKFPFVLGYDLVGMVRPCSITSVGRASGARFGSLPAAGRSWLTAWPARGTTPATCSSRSSARMACLGSGVSLPMAVGLFL